MRRLILLFSLVALAFGSLTFASPASAAPTVNCGSLRATIGTQKYVLAIKIKVKGLPCSTTKEFWKAFATGEQGDAMIEDLRTNCKPGSKASQKAAEKKNRSAYVCRSSDGKITTKAWVPLGG